MKRLVLLVAIILCIGLTGCQEEYLEKTEEVTATVTEKEYKSSYTTSSVISTGKTIIVVPQRHPARYLVTVEYKSVSNTFDDKDLYETLKEGDNINVILETYTVSGGQTRQELCLPKKE